MGKSSSLINMDIVGAEDLEQSLRDLGRDKEIRKTLAASLIQAGEPMAKAARGRAPAKTGEMREGVDVSLTLSRRQRRSGQKPGPDGAVVYLGAKPVGPAILIEFGTTKRHWKNGKSTGHTPAHPFMRPAFEETKVEVLLLFSKLLWIEIAKATARIARRQAKLLGAAK